MRKFYILIILPLLFACNSSEPEVNADYYSLHNDTVNKDTTSVAYKKTSDSLSSATVKRKLDSLGIELVAPKNKDGKSMTSEEYDKWFFDKQDSISKSKGVY